MNYDYDKDKIKSELTLEQIEEILTEFGGEPIRKGDVIISRTICHNPIGEGSHKLYYYQNSQLCHCYTGCAEASFDIFELVRKVMSREQPKQREDPNWNLPEAIDYVARKFGYAPNILKNKNDNLSIVDDLKLFDKYERINNIDIVTQNIELKEYDDSFLKNMPHPRIPMWEEEGIDPEIIKAAEICFDPVHWGIVIPHRDINNRLIGVRERTLVTEQEQYGKYKPAIIGKKMYNHPLSYNLYNLNHSKYNIQKMEKAFIFEGEKSCLKYRSFFGEENDLSVSICGSSLINYQVWLLSQLGVKEIIVSLDKQFQTSGDDEFLKLVRNLKNIHKKYGRFIKISFMWDKENILGYKDSPIDKTKDEFLYLYKKRINLY